MADYPNRKVTVEDVKEAASRGLMAAEIADLFAVSKQRISQIVKKHEIEVRRARRDIPEPKPQPEPGRRRKRKSEKIRPPAIPLLTGGIHLAQTTAAAGSVAELLVAADLMARGWHVYFPLLRQRGHDLIAYKGDDFLTIEVRPGHRAQSGKVVFRPNYKMQSSHYALVITGEPVAYDPPIPDLPRTPIRA